MGQRSVLLRERHALHVSFRTATADVQVAIYRSYRASREAPFSVPERVAAISGLVEAPSLSGDGRSLYYHKREGSRFVIYRVARR